jgi:PncC family amidohydrolase
VSPEDARLDALRDSATEAAGRLIEALSGSTLACAESCTGGLVSAILTAVPGASRAFVGGVVSYSNGLKERALGVGAEALRVHGAVSREVARAMAAGALAASGAAYSIATTGVAGPSGGTPGKPIGLVWLAWASSGGGSAEEELRLGGSREEIRLEAARLAIEGCIRFVASARETGSTR